MIEFKKIKELVGNHVSPYIYNSKEFLPGKTPIYYSGPYWDNNETNCDSVDVISSIIINLINKNEKGVFNVGTEIKSIYDLALKSNKNVNGVLKPPYVPNDITMNINKLKSIL
jgi:hypothetical protein